MTWFKTCFFPGKVAVPIRNHLVKPRHFHKTPVLLTVGVLGLLSLFQWLGGWFPERDPFVLADRLEWMSYDFRVRQAMGHPQVGDHCTNIAAVFIDDESLTRVNDALSYAWPWPRKLHGQLIRKLKEAGVQAIGFDILFQERHPSNSETDIRLANGLSIDSDQYFASQIIRAGNVVLAAFGETQGDQWRGVMPADMFLNNAKAVAHATSEKDHDGVLRRVRAYRDDPEHGRLWHMGIVMAAQALSLDLENAEVQPDRITLHGPNGLTRTLPVDPDGLFYVNWQVYWNDPRIAKTSFEQAAGFLGDAASDEVLKQWQGKLVFVGSIGSGNNISDVGATPLAKETYLVSNHWNVANSIITDRYVRPPSRLLGLLLILACGIFSALVTWRARAPWPTVIVLVTAVAYVGAALSLFIQQRYWLPIVLPVFGGLGLTHVSLVIYQVLFEQEETRHVRQVFSRLVSPEVVTELLEAEKLNLGGARREMTVMFTDVRGFTQMTDSQQEEAEAHVRQAGLPEMAAHEYFNDRARDTLATVNCYLAAIADQIKCHNGTLDKYIGDCVMAFWGAPVHDPFHAVHCVEAAIDSHRAIHKLNAERVRENTRRQAINQERWQQGLEVLPLFPILTLGTGVNTGEAVVGLMGSEEHILNYTVFGRDVNVASRLEAVSGRGRIIIGEMTFRHLERFRPDLAAGCEALPAVTVKGIRVPVMIYEVPWKTEIGNPSASAEDTTREKAA